MKKKTTILLAVLAFLCALGLTLYPLIAAKYNEAHQSAIHADYREIVAQKTMPKKRKSWKLHGSTMPLCSPAYGRMILRICSCGHLKIM